MIIGVKRWAIIVGFGCVVASGLGVRSALKEEPCVSFTEIYGLSEGERVECNHPAQVMDVHPMYTNGGQIVCRCPNTPESGHPLKK
jgi:hypothetical protein